MMKAVVAVDDNWGIGCGGDLLVRIPDDMRNFKEKTVGKTVIMGNCTFRSLPSSSPLKDRVNIVLSHDSGLRIKGALVMNSIEDVLDLVDTIGSDDTIVIGGQSVYEQLLPYCDTAYVTRMHIPESMSRRPDRFFVNLDESDEWELEESSTTEMYEGVEYKFCTYHNRRCLSIDRRRELFLPKDRCTAFIPRRFESDNYDEFFVELLDTLFSYMRPMQDGLNRHDVEEYQEYADRMDFIHYLEFKRYVSRDHAFDDLFRKYCVPFDGHLDGYMINLRYEDLDRFNGLIYTVDDVNGLASHFDMTPVRIAVTSHEKRAAD